MTIWKKDRLLRHNIYKTCQKEKVDLTANSLHPGVIATNLLRHNSILEGMFDWVGRYFIKTIPQGAATTCYGVSGEYFLDCNKAKPSSRTKDPELARKLWDFSLSMAAPSE